MPVPIIFVMCPEHVTCLHPYIMGRYCRIPTGKSSSWTQWPMAPVPKRGPNGVPTPCFFLFFFSIPEPSKGAAMFFQVLWLCYYSLCWCCLFFFVMCVGCITFRSLGSLSYCFSRKRTHLGTSSEADPKRLS